MTELGSLLGDLSVNSHTWTYEYLDGNGRHYWYREMTDDEVQDVSDGRFDSVDDIDIPMASPPDYPIYQIELNPLSGGDQFEVTASRTRLAGTVSSAMRTPLGGDYTQTVDSVDDAVQAVEEFARRLS